MVPAGVLFQKYGQSTRFTTATRYMRRQVTFQELRVVLSMTLLMQLASLAMVNCRMFLSKLLLDHYIYVILLGETGSATLQGDTTASLKRSASSGSLESAAQLLEQREGSRGLGQIEYSLQYHRYILSLAVCWMHGIIAEWFTPNRDSEQLVLHIIQARDLVLPSSPMNGDRLDCFIKAYSSNCNEQQPKKQTKVGAAGHLLYTHIYITPTLALA